ncbi:phosphoribosylformylglycinamidine synthase [Clostridium massiliamazoniense]|uniref:phosphoribosylformylglycinamidine synthase n=1 Tax=Clostridium massiliamazoniense TaxID=1347366 RepID=UPI0006D77A36|nr:phosphoribosylformylglycinamidine synthase [Clostridium massiliamazoniense]
MGFIFFVEKKDGFNVEAKELLNDFKLNLNIINLENVRVLNKYTFDKENLNGIESIIHEPQVDILYKEEFVFSENEKAFAMEYLPGQYDQRADSTEQCYFILNNGEKIKCKTGKVIILKGNVSEKDIYKIKKYYINNVDSKEVSPFDNKIMENNIEIQPIEKINDFIDYSLKEIEKFHKSNSLSMTINDLLLVQEYFKEEERNPTITEIKVIDTYWSDHCRHTTFQTVIKNIEIEKNKFTNPLKETLATYEGIRKVIYKDKNKDITFMDIAVIAMKEMKRRGVLDDLDLSEEINACSINVKLETTEGFQDYLIMFKNETHNHPTEIEPFGGAATCLGGAIRDPLSGRSYVYQAMRITGSADPRNPIDETLKGKLPQRVITLGAAHGYSSYGNQIGLATGEVREIYHEGYKAKRMEIGAVIAAAPKKNVVRMKPEMGDVIILLGGKTGRDGCGGATGSSKEHNVTSIETCGTEVQKGNAPTERKIQRLFKKEKVTTLIKRCNDFGAGGVSVAIGELCDSLDIDLSLVPKKYEGLDGTEIAISESQERMAVVISEKDKKKFIEFAEEENLEATEVARVTDTGYMRMFWNDELIVNLKRSFLNTNGAKQEANVKVRAPKNNENYFERRDFKSVKEEFIKLVQDINICSQKGLVERFDGTIGAGSVLMPFGGKYQLTPSEGMVAKVPVENGESLDCTIMTSGFNPLISSWSPFHGAYYSVIEAVTKVVAIGGDYKKVRLTLQEYFERLGKDEERWGKPFAALLGALRAQIDLNLAAIGGKDSMSGSFDKLDVPPTLVSFAVAVEKVDNIISPEFKNKNSKVLLIKTNREENELLDIEQYKLNLSKIRELIETKDVISAYSIKEGGILEGIFKMAIGNKIGFILNEEVKKDDLKDKLYGSMILEVNNDFDLSKLTNINYTILGHTTDNKNLNILNENFDLDELIALWEDGLNSVFKIKTKDINQKVDNLEFYKKTILVPKNNIVKPRVIIPAFPGTNCEEDSKRAFDRAGASSNVLVFRNLNKEQLEDSILKLEEEIRSSQIIMLPGGFSAGDEPDGSGKFIATVFRNERIKDAVMDLLKNRDGLLLGICNGFQALIKLGLVPYGEITNPREDMPTLTYNKIGRHVSSIVNTRISSNLSPWFNSVEVDDIYKVAVSHGEGRFVANETIINELIRNGQVATQYVDLNGKATMNMPYNPNGSDFAIEAITSPDGRVLGKMGHSERIGKNLYKNVEGNFDQKVFESGVKYFK